MYYPKSQIKTNLYSNNNFTIIETQKLYTGYYWETSTGKYYTGKTPQDTPTLELTPYDNEDGELFDLAQNTNFIVSSYSIYTLLKNIDTNQTPLIPSYSPTYPTQQDYQVGEFIRYFCKKVNELIYLEINKDTYNKLSSQDPTIAFQYYIPFDIPWQLIGDKEQVYKINKNITELTMKQQKLPQFDLYLKKDYTKYYQ